LDQTNKQTNKQTIGGRTDTLPAGVEGSPPILKELLLIEKGRMEDAVSASHITLQTGRSRNEAGEFSPKQFTR
jgi:hypothetical protein